MPSTQIAYFDQNLSTHIASVLLILPLSSTHFGFYSTKSMTFSSYNEPILLKISNFSTGIAYFIPKSEYYCLYFHCLYFKMSVL